MRWRWERCSKQRGRHGNSTEVQEQSLFKGLEVRGEIEGKYEARRSEEEVKRVSEDHVRKGLNVSLGKSMSIL